MLPHPTLACLFPDLAFGWSRSRNKTSPLNVFSSLYIYRSPHRIVALPRFHPGCTAVRRHLSLRLAPPCAKPHPIANAHWQHHRCPACASHEAILISSRHIPTNTEISAPRSQLFRPNTYDPLPEHVLSFDGGARDRRGGDGRAAGAGGIIWSISLERGPRLLASSRIDLPLKSCLPPPKLGVCASRCNSSFDTPHQQGGTNYWRRRSGDHKFAAARGRLRDSTATSLLASLLRQISMKAIGNEYLAFGGALTRRQVNMPRQPSCTP